MLRPSSAEKKWIERTTPELQKWPTDPWDVSWPKGVRKHLKYPHKTLHQVFEEAVQRNGDRPYLSILGMEFSYSQVNDMANRFAAALKARGYGPGDNIGLFMPNLPQFVVAFFGVLKAGATVVPISPLYGQEDLKTTVKDSQIKAIVALDLLFESLETVFREIGPLQDHIFTSLSDLLSPLMGFLARLLGKIPKSPKITLPHERLYDLIKNHPPLAKSASVDPKSTIAVIGYTGGTTGVPKGAMLSHENLVCNLHQGREWARIAHPIGVHKKFVGAVPFFHIIGLNAVMLVSMFYDSTVYLFPDPRKFEAILKDIEKHQINYFHGVPTLHQAILNHPKFSKYDLTSLEIIFSGAAPLPKALGQRIEQETGAMVIEAYGMTETSPMVSANPFERDNRRFGTIGIPFPDTEIKIIPTEKPQPAGLGEIGEVAIRGPQVMQGYWKNPEETAKTLHDGYIFTGDMGYMDQTGFIYLVNRKKDMIIASGYKVFPSELEQLLMDNFSEFQEAVVTAAPDEYRGETVKLIAVLKEGATISKDKIIDFFKEKVASYKIPKIVEFRKELPKTSIGKVDRKAIRQQEFGAKA